MDQQQQEIGGYELAEQVTGLCRGTLYAMVCLEQIPHVRLSSRLVRFRRTDLEAWLQAKLVEVNPEKAAKKAAKKKAAAAARKKAARSVQRAANA